MADGDNLVIGAQNQGDAATLLFRDGTQTRLAIQVTNSNGSGILGESIDQHPTSIGVLGTSPNGIGMIALGQTGLMSRAFQGNGVETDSDSGFALLARSKFSTGVQAMGRQLGVEAFSTGRDGAAGVRGTATHGVEGFGTEIGVLGRVDTSAGGPTSSFVGVAGLSNSSHGVFGKSTAPTGGPLVIGVAGRSDDVGVGGESDVPSGTGVLGLSKFGIAIGGSSRFGFAGLFKGKVGVIGDFIVIGGGKAAALRDSSGRYRRLYAVESPESWLEDFGSAKLVRGRVRVRLKSDFSQFIKKRDYHVFVTPEGDSNGLYVTGKTSVGFDVAEQQSGRSNVSFSYRIVAKRRDLWRRRLDEIKMPKDLSKMDRNIREPRIPEPPGGLKSMMMAAKKKPNAKTLASSLRGPYEHGAKVRRR